MPMLVLHWFFIFDNGSTVRIDEQSCIQSECCVLMCSGGIIIVTVTGNKGTPSPILFNNQHYLLPSILHQV